MKRKKSNKPVARKPWEAYQDGRYWKVQGVGGSFANESEAREYAGIVKSGRKPSILNMDSKSKKTKYLDSDILIRVPLKLRQYSKTLAKRRGVTLSELIRALLTKEIYKG